MRKVISIFLSILMVFSISGCSALEPDTITIPASLLSAVNTAELEEQISDYCQSYTENEDGSITVVIGKIQHTMVLSQISETIQGALDESYPNDDAPGITSITCSDDFTTATITLDSEDISTSGLPATIAVVSAYYACSLYQFAAGIDESEVSTDICFVDAESNLLQESTFSYTEMSETSSITIPSGYITSLGLDDIETQISDYCESVSEDEDGNLVVVINEMQRSLLLAYISDYVQSLLEDAFPNDNFSDLEAMTFSDDFTEVTLSVSAFDGNMSALYTYFASYFAYFIAGFYQIAAGVDESDVVLSVSIENSDTGELYQEFSLPPADDEDEAESDQAEITPDESQDTSGVTGDSTDADTERISDDGEDVFDQENLYRYGTIVNEDGVEISFGDTLQSVALQLGSPTIVETDDELYEWSDPDNLSYVWPDESGEGCLILKITEDRTIWEMLVYNTDEWSLTCGVNAGYSESDIISALGTPSDYVSGSYCYYYFDTDFSEFSNGYVGIAVGFEGQSFIIFQSDFVDAE